MAATSSTAHADPVKEPTDSLDKLALSDNFRFFGLAREMRNAIYRHSTAPLNEVVTDAYGVCRVKASAWLTEAPRLVNKQFKAEYEEEVFRGLEVVLETPVMKAMMIDCLKASSLQPFMGKIQHVTLKLSVPEDQDLINMEDVDWVAQNALSRILGALSSVQSLQLTVQISVQGFERCIRSHSYNPLRFWEIDVLAAAPPKHDIPIQKRLLLNAELYGVNKKLIDDHELGRRLSGAEGNRITYSAQPAMKGRGWHGLELDTAVAGMFDFRAIARELECKRAAENEEDMSTWWNQDDDEVDDFESDEECAHGGSDED